MKKDCIVDYLGYIAVKLLGPLIRALPKSLSFFLGKKLGETLYYFDLKHKAVVYANIKAALGNKLSVPQINCIAKEFYQRFGQNIIEIFLIPLVNQDYIKKYITIKGTEHISEAFKKGKGVILLAMHAGSWELSNIICANLGFPFSLLVRDQKHPRLNHLLNLYRQQKGCRIIQKQRQTRLLIQTLKNNEAVGMTIDQGGKGGTLVKFFSRNASMPSGAVKLALKYGVAIIPAYYRRIKGAYIETVIGEPFKIKKTGDLEKDVRENLRELVSIFEGFIEDYPEEYLWSYKIWKYSDEKKLLILSDGKAGHLRQSQSIAQIMAESFKSRAMQLETETIEVKFKNKFSKQALLLSSGLSGRYHCQGCLWCLRKFLQRDSCSALISSHPDYIVSSGASLAAINFILSRENLSKSIVNMRPSILSTARFDLVIMPRHDSPTKKRNVLVSEGALNMIDERYLAEQSRDLLQAFGLEVATLDPAIALFIGGNSKNFRLRKDTILEAIEQIKVASQKLNANILVTTSRRTTKEIECLVKEQFKDYPGCKILIIANEKNIPSAAGGILGLSRLVVVSPESISMVCEAATSKKYVVVFNSPGLDKRHKRFLDYFLKNKYIFFSHAKELGVTIERIWKDRPQTNSLKDRHLIKTAIERLI